MSKRSGYRWLMSTSLLLVFLLSACKTDILSSQPDTGIPPALPDLEPGVWHEFTPGEDTVCANGSEYKFFVYSGTVNKVVIDFMGGGACWDFETCSKPHGSSSESFYIDRVLATPDGFPGYEDFPGIYGHDNPENPFKDWYHVFISYCTGDLHIGDAVHTYTGPGDDVTVEHRGGVNAGAALDWIFDSFEAPENIFVTGCSAGAYGSILWLPEIARHYPQANLVQLGDSGAGIVTQSFLDSGIVHWNIADAVDRIPDIGGVGEPLPTDLLARTYRAVGQTFPNLVVSQYNTLFDGVQIFFYEQMGGEALTWSGQMLTSLDEVAADTDNFTYYTALYDFDSQNGTPHCIINRDEFYSLETAGVKLSDWIEVLLRGVTVEPIVPQDAKSEEYRLSIVIEE